MLDPNVVLDNSWLPDYQKWQEILSHQFRVFDTRLLYLEKIYDFPFNILFDPNKDFVFWSTLINCLSESVIMVAWRIIVDTNSDSMNLRRFKNEIFPHITNTNAKDEFSSQIKSVDFETRIDSISRQIKELRHNYVAHLNYDAQVNQTTRGIPVKDLRTIFQVATDLFYVLCMGTKHVTLDLRYAFAPNGTYLDRLIYDLADSSPFMRMPETSPAEWVTYRNKFQGNDLENFNRYRRKLGLDEIK